MEVLMILFTLMSLLVFQNEVVDHMIYLTPDIYTLVSLLGLQLFSNEIVSGLLAAFTIVFAIAFIAVMVLTLYKFYEICKNFMSLAKIDVVLKRASRVHTFLSMFIFFISISYIIPSFGWIIATILAFIFMIVAFSYFHLVLKKYGLRMQIIKDTSFLIALSSFFNIVAAGLVFIDISFLLVSVLGYLFLFLGIRRFRKQIQFR